MSYLIQFIVISLGSALHLLRFPLYFILEYFLSLVLCYTVWIIEPMFYKIDPFIWDSFGWGILLELASQYDYEVESAWLL